ncbi:MAG: META domain-containing protein [Maricaulaceae bacterium]
MKLVKTINLSLCALFITAPAFAQSQALISKSSVNRVKEVSTKVSYPNLAGTIWAPDNTIGQIISFDTTGGVSGFGGCSYFEARFYQDNHHMQLGDFRTKKALCEKVQALETTFFNNLNTVWRMNLSGSELQVYSPSGKRIMALTQQKTTVARKKF